MNKKYKYLIIISLIVFSFIAFGRILSNDFINLDDNFYITDNSHIKSGINIETIRWALTTTYFSYWHPLTWLSHMLDWSLFGANASGHHFMSLLLHIGAVLFLFLFLNKTTKALWPSAFVAAFFALHPLRVESVAWAAERKDVLSMFFGMAVLYSYALYVESNKISKYFFCLALFALSLMSKPMLVTLPCVLLLLDYWPLGRWQKALNPPPNDKTQVTVSKPQKKKSKKSKAGVIGEKKLAAPVKSNRQIANSLLWEKAPFILLSIILSISLIWQQKAVGGMVSLEIITVPMRIINAIVSYVAYLGKIFWPINLAIFYPYQHSFPTWQILGAFLLLAGISTAVIYLARKAPFLAVGWIWYLVTLFPVIGLLQAGEQAMADRYTYLPFIGIAIMLVWSLLYLVPKERLRKIILFPAAVLVLAIFTLLTWLQCGYWKNSINLFTHTLRVTKNNDLAHYNLAVAFKDQGQMEEAFNHLQKSVKIRPSSDAHNNLGIILEMYLKKYDEAIYHYKQAMQLKPDNPDIYYNMGIALAKKGDLEGATESFQAAIYLNPDFKEARQALDLALSMKQE